MDYTIAQTGLRLRGQMAANFGIRMESYIVKMAQQQFGQTATYIGFNRDCCTEKMVRQWLGLMPLCGNGICVV